MTNSPSSAPAQQTIVTPELWNTGIDRCPTFGLSDLEEMLAETSPVVLRKTRPAHHGENPFLAAAAAFGFKPPLDVEKRLAEMTYMGGDDAAVHGTRLARGRRAAEKARIGQTSGCSGTIEHLAPRLNQWLPREKVVD